ncbi:hypothetical protein NKH18_04370 [Streptomyces sp. M10(2022)]
MPKSPSVTAVPADPCEAGRAVSGSVTEKSGPIPGGSPQALVMVGDPGTSELLSATLALAGYRTAATGSGAEALPWLAECRFHLVVLDVTLPDLDDLKQSNRFLAPTVRPYFCSPGPVSSWQPSGGAGVGGGRNRITPVRVPSYATATSSWTM